MNESTVTFQPADKLIMAPPGTRIMDLARILNIAIPFTCGGKGRCGQCKISIREGMETLGPLTGSERKLLSAEEVQEGWRLGCAIWAPAAADLLIDVPEGPAERLKIHTDGAFVIVEPDAAVRRYVIKRPQTRSEGIASFERMILEDLTKEHGLTEASFGYEALLQLSRIVNDPQEYGHVEVTVLCDREILAVERERRSGPYGIAVDLGTTTVVCYLLDLNNGNIVSISSSVNDQSAMGEDVMTRIAFAIEKEENLERLQSAIIETVNRLIEDCCGAAGIAPEDIYTCCCAGNTCMQHIFLGLSPQSLGFSPYRPVTQRGITITRDQMHHALLMNKKGKIYVFPSIAGFVGGDNISVQMVVNHLSHHDGVKLILDIGTNTEIALVDSRSAVVCSCPSGPAFEGMHMTHGVRGVIGAIERVTMTLDPVEVTYETIGHAKPIGICGSGLVDAIAGLLQSGLLQRNGVFRTEAATLRLRAGTSGQREFVVVWKEETDSGKDIVLNQQDIVEFQKAKAAIQAACKILMQRKNIAEHQIEEIYIAGAFGQYIDPAHAILTGMLPSVPIEKIKAIGNAAGMGARMVLLSRTLQREAEEMARKAEYIELSRDPEFSREFMRSMFFSQQNA